MVPPDAVAVFTSCDWKGGGLFLTRNTLAGHILGRACWRSRKKHGLESKPLTSSISTRQAIALAHTRDGSQGLGIQSCPHVALHALNKPVSPLRQDIPKFRHMESHVLLEVAIASSIQAWTPTHSPPNPGTVIQTSFNGDLSQWDVMCQMCATWLVCSDG